MQTSVIIGWAVLIFHTVYKESRVRTSAAAAAAAFGSFSVLLFPNVRGGPPTVLLGAPVTLPGTEALVAGAGADPRVRP
jgi:hypothetical protein